MMVDHAEYLGHTTTQLTRGRWYQILEYDRGKQLYRIMDDWGLEGWFPRKMFVYHSEIH